MTGLLPVDRPVDRARSRPTGRSTDVPNMPSQGPVDRTVDRQRASALWKWPGRPLGHCPVCGRPVGRPICPTVKNSTIGGRLSAVLTAELASNGHILDAYKRGFPWAVLYNIFGEFQSQFFLSIVEAFSTCFNAKISKSKGEFIKRFLKWFLWVFHHQINPSFSHTHLSFPLLYPSYRRVVVRVVLGDQSVVITKFFIFVLRRRTCGFALFRVLVRAQCRGAALAS